MLTIDLLETNKQIEKKILDAIAEHINTVLLHNKDVMRQNIADETFTYLQSTNIYQSLIDGDLAGHFGLSPRARRNNVDSILARICANIVVETKPLVFRGGNFVGGMTVQVLIKDFSDILLMIEGTVMTERGDLLPWLRWLLLEGDRILVTEHDVVPSVEGRSKKMIMFKDTAKVWRVPTEYAGTIFDNWLTKAILSNDYFQLIEHTIEKAFI